MDWYTQLFALRSGEDFFNVELPGVNANSWMFSSRWICLLRICSVIFDDFGSHNVYTYGFGWEMADMLVIWIPRFYIQHSLEAAVVCLCVCVFFRLCHPTGWLQTQRSKRRADLSPPHTPAAVPLPVPMATGGYAPEKDVLINLHQVRLVISSLSHVAVVAIVVQLAVVKWNL